MPHSFEPTIVLRSKFDNHTATDISSGGYWFKKERFRHEVRLLPPRGIGAHAGFDARADDRPGLGPDANAGVKLNLSFGGGWGGYYGGHYRYRYYGHRHYRYYGHRRYGHHGW